MRHYIKGKGEGILKVREGVKGSELEGGRLVNLKCALITRERSQTSSHFCDI